MNNSKIYFILLVLVTVLFTACELVDPMASEQYEKNIYIVGANTKVAFLTYLMVTNRMVLYLYRPVEHRKWTGM